MRGTVRGSVGRPTLGTRTRGSRGLVGVAPSLGRRTARGSLGWNGNWNGRWGGYRLGFNRFGINAFGANSWWYCGWNTPFFANQWNGFGFGYGCFNWWNPHLFWTVYSPFTFQRYVDCFPLYSYTYDYCWWPGRRTYIPLAWYDDPGVAYVDDGAALASAPAPAAPAAAAAPATSESLADRFVELGDFYFKEGRYADAADSYARARTYAPDDATIHFVLADALFATGDYHFAAFLISEAVRLDPEIVRADADKRKFYGNPEQFAEQMATLEGYIKDKPYDAAAHFVYGYNLFFSARPADAVKAFEQVLTIEPSHAAAQAFLASAAERVAASKKVEAERSELIR